MKNFTLDCGGLTFDEVMALQTRLEADGIFTGISVGALSVEAQRDEFRTKYPDLKDRVLNQGEQTFAAEFMAAVKEA